MFENMVGSSNVMVTVDLNGIKNPPNMEGFDTFTFQLVNDELPKSCFDKNYLKSGKNELARFLIEYKNIYEYEIIPAQIIVSKKIS